MLYTVAALWACITSSRGGEPIHLAGEQDGYYERAEYLVWQSVVVQEGKVLRFASGSVVRFKPMTGIEVKGTLKCIGTADRPITFTSYLDDITKAGDAEDPGPFDWSGVTVRDSGARIIARHVRLSYSTYGIEIGSAEKVDCLDSVIFSSNGRQNISVDGEILSAPNGVPFSWARPGIHAEGTRVVEADPVVEISPIEKGARRVGSWRVPARILLGVAAVAGGAVAVAGHVGSQRSYRQYHDTEREPMDTTEASILEKQDRLQEYESQTLRLRRLGNGGIIIGGIGAAGFAVTFFF